MTKERQHICPNCAKKFAVTEEIRPFRPFCCKRCKMADLGQWLQEKYVVEGEEASNFARSENNDDGEQD
jgi:endogenous inhibitor of DNA gyrase (YacG/DUF329 family)